MQLTKWARQRNDELFREAGKTNRAGRPRAKRGAFMELCRKSQVSYVTVLKAARDGLPVTAEVARKLSAATGGVCSPEEIEFPKSVARPVASQPAA